MMSTFHVRVGLCLLASVAALALGAAGVTAAAPAAGSPRQQPAFVPGEVLVALEPAGGAAALGTVAARITAASRTLGVSRGGRRFARIVLRPGTPVSEAVETYRRDAAVAAAAPNYLNRPALSPSDTWFQNVPNYMWGMRDTGQDLSGENPSYATNASDATADNDVDGPEAWDVTTGSAGVVVAVVDSGVDFTHPDLSGAMWDATGATFGGSPQGSSYHGWDFADGDDDPYPVNDAHGSHVAGTVGASGDNALGVPGMAYGAEVMALKVFPSAGGGATDADIVSAINFAVENGADVINLSLGRGGSESSVMTLAVEDAVAAGVLLVAAAGNSDSDNDLNAQWPANYAGEAGTAPGVIAVMATDQADARASFSNYGPGHVTIGAPGVNIWSTTTGRLLVLQETGSGLTPPVTTDCSINPDTCFDSTIFDNGATDCTGTNCQWGLEATSGGLLYVLADMGEGGGSGTYTASADGTIVTQAQDVSTTQRLILRYVAAWDLECDADFVDVEVWDGGNWQRLQAPSLNIADSLLAYCSSAHTHTGRMDSFFGSARVVAHDISAYANANAALQVRFTYGTDGATSTTAVPYAFQAWDVTFDEQASDYTGAYEFRNGTSMAAPMVSGIAALVKSQNPAYDAADIKRAIVGSGDPVGGFGTLVTSGMRINAANAVRYVLPPAGVTITPQ